MIHTPRVSSLARRVVAVLALVAVPGLSACAGAARPAVAAAPPPSAAPSPSPAEAPASETPVAQESSPAAIAQARADSARHPYTQADIDFMSNMIGHHRQAIHIAQWAASRGASPSVQTLAARIINAQQDEISIMSTWLRDRRQPVPEHDSTGMTHMMDGMKHEMLMPGMLTAAQLKELEAARGPEFDRLFLTYMIQHHGGAVEMVKTLFSTYGAGQDEAVFKFASDVNVDQTTEIARMQRMLILNRLQGGSK